MSAGSTLQALGYVGVRETVARAKRFLRNPVAVVVAALTAIGLGVSLVYGRSGLLEVGTSSNTQDLYIAILAVVLLISCWNAVAVCPIRLRGADLAWLAPRSGADRALALWHMLAVPARFLLLGSIGMVGAAVLAGAAPWRALYGGVIAYTLLRAIPTLVHLVALRIAPRVVALATRLALTSISGSALLVAIDQGEVLPTVLDVVTAPFRDFLGALVASVTAPTEPTGLVVAAVVTGSVVAAAFALGSGYMEAAARRTWEFEATASAVLDGSMTGEVMAEAISRQVRRGISSLTRDFGLRGEWALTWRALAGWRRSWRPIGLVVGTLFVAAVVLAVLVPRAGGLPVTLLAGASILFPQTGMLEESDHVAVYRNPGRPFLKAVAVDVIPIVVTSFSIGVLALPPLMVTGATAGAVLWGAFAVFSAVAAIIAVGGAACLRGRTVARRMVLSIVVGFGTALALLLSFVVARLIGVVALVGPLVTGLFIAMLAWGSSAAEIARS